MANNLTHILSRDQLLLRRRLVDFSSECSMEGPAQALKEHYGISPCASVTDKATRKAGAAAKSFNAEVPAAGKTAEVLAVDRRSVSRTVRSRPLRPH